MLKVANEHGYATQDLNGANQTGTMITQSTFANGVRSTTSNCFIEDDYICPNLTTLTKSFVRKILFSYNDQAVPIATGVLFEKNGKEFKVYANKEIILSAG